MSGLISALQNLLTSIINTILAFFQSLAALFTTAFNTVFALVKETGGFVINNIVVILIVAGAFIGWGAYQQRVQQGRVGSRAGGHGAPVMSGNLKN